MGALTAMKCLSLIADFFLPRRCVVCSKRLQKGEAVVCGHCLLSNPMDGVFINFADNRMVDCLKGRGDVVRANALFEFHPGSPMSSLVYKLKYRGRADIGVLMGRHVAQVLAPRGFFDGVDMMVPVPITRRRRLQRGFNQSEMISEGISEVTGIPVDSKSLRRVRFAGSQTTLSGVERMANVDGAFILADSEPLSSRHVLIVDDIFTTGATVSACMREISSKTSGTRFTILTLGMTKP